MLKARHCRSICLFLGVEIPKVHALVVYEGLGTPSISYFRSIWKMTMSVTFGIDGIRVWRGFAKIRRVIITPVSIDVINPVRRNEAMNHKPNNAVFINQYGYISFSKRDPNHSITIASAFPCALPCALPVFPKQQATSAFQSWNDKCQAFFFQFTRLWFHGSPNTTGGT